MKQTTLVAEQFGNTAAAYLTSTVHAQGDDIQAAVEVIKRYSSPNVLDLGCGAGHISYAVAPFSGSVTAYDLSKKMLALIKKTSEERTLKNIITKQGLAEKLTFPDATFDVIITRFSAHHWFDVPAALKEARRVLRANGVIVVIDIISPENSLHDTTLQAVELLRDASHVRDYRASEWASMFVAADLEFEVMNTWRLKMEFNEWIARMRTPPERSEAIRSLFNSAPEETKSYFTLSNDYSFFIDAAFFEVRKAS